MKTNANPTAEKSVSRLVIEEHPNGGFTVSTENPRGCGERSEIIASYTTPWDLMEGLEVMVGASAPDPFPRQPNVRQAVRAAVAAE